MWLNSLLVEQSPSQLDGTKLREIFCLGYKFASLCACFLVTQYLKTESVYLKIQISDSFWKKKGRSTNMCLSSCRVTMGWRGGCVRWNTLPSLPQSSEVVWQALWQAWQLIDYSHKTLLGRYYPSYFITGKSEAQKGYVVSQKPPT